MDSGLYINFIRIFFGLFLTSAGFIYFSFFKTLLLSNSFDENRKWILASAWVIIFASPWVFIIFTGNKNECCAGMGNFDTAIFSPDHRLTAFAVIIAYTLAYFYAAYRQKIAAPLIEILTNAFLVLGVVFNVFVGIHILPLPGIIGNGAAIMLLLMRLMENQALFIQNNENQHQPGNRAQKLAWKILSLKPIVKFPVLFLLCLPIMVLLVAFLMLFGQKPDSIIRAFTDTYKQVFSQLDHECDNVVCGDHYLCSVAANGHTQLVKPKRFGVRNGGKIICNRQLLVSNAFEELIQEKFPFVHKAIRKQYNKVGNTIHKHYHIFNIKWVSDIIYLLMKPLEWFFLFVLYTFDRNPENRIAQQYLSKSERESIAEIS